jgi:hypothetical protein
MLRKSVIACLVATSFVVATALMVTGASAGRGSVPSPGTWNWPPYAEGWSVPRTTCGYVRVNPRGQAMGLRVPLKAVSRHSKVTRFREGPTPQETL